MFITIIKVSLNNKKTDRTSNGSPGLYIKKSRQFVGQKNLNERFEFRFGSVIQRPRQGIPIKGNFGPPSPNRVYSVLKNLLFSARRN